MGPGIQRQEVTRNFFQQIAPRKRWARLQEDELPAVHRVLAELGLGPGKSVVEPGCGAGRLTAEISRAVGPGGWVFSFDLAPKMIERARTERPRNNVSYSVNSAVDIPLNSGSMDAAICYNCFHLFDCPPGAARELARVLAPGGRMAIVQSESMEELFREDYLPTQLSARVIPSLADMIAIMKAFGFRVVKLPRIGQGFFMLVEKA